MNALPTTSSSSTNHEQEADIIIVGGGAAGIGLLYGLLLPYTCDTCGGGGNESGSSGVETKLRKLEKNKKKPNFTIALIERGGAGTRTASGATSETGTKTGGIHRRQKEEYIVRDPKQWFIASHPLFQSSSEASSATATATVYHSVPQRRGLNGRKLLIPTGRGLGGGTNINATLVTKPSNDDFIYWPKLWREKQPMGGGGCSSTCGSRIMIAIETILDTMRHNGALTRQTAHDFSFQQQKRKLSNSKDAVSKDYQVHTNKNDDSYANRKSNNGFMEVNIHDKNMYKREEDGSFDTTTIDVIKLQSFSCAAVRKKDKDENSSNWNESYERVNAYEALIVPLLEKNPHLNDIVTFYTNVQVERLMIDKLPTSSSSSSSYQKYLVRGVECRNTMNNSNKDVSDVPKGEHQYFQIKARKKVMLCAGAILSPALLLVSGVGDHSELVKEGIVPLQSIPPSLSSSPSSTTLKSNILEDNGGKNDHNRWKGVGKKLRDHFIVTKAFFIPPCHFWSTMKSINAVRGWVALDIVDKASSKDNDNGNSSTMSSRSSKEHMGINNVKNSPKARVFFKVVDGTSSSFIIPYVLTSYFYRENTAKTRRRPNLSSLWNCITIGKVMFSIVRIVLSFLFQFYPLQWLLRHCTAQILLCLLNPNSTGTVTIRRKKCPNSSYQKEENHLMVGRLSDFEIVIDPGYITDEEDMVRIQNSWGVLDSVCSKWFSNCIEVLPGLLYKMIFGKTFLRQYAADFGLPYFHWSGTVPMQTSCTVSHGDGVRNVQNDDDALSVVDDRLNVKNIQNLHVCDASVIPGNISGPLALTCLGLGYVCASLIEEDLMMKYD